MPPGRKRTRLHHRIPPDQRRVPVDRLDSRSARAADAIVINPAGWSHTSVAVMDALATCTCPILEVHISNIHRREEFRHHSYVSSVAVGVICGFGTHGYPLALQHLAKRFKA